MRLEALPEGASIGIALAPPAPGLILLRDGGIPRAYVNSCPHRGTPLDLLPDRFRDDSGRFLVCSTHGARFRIEDGFCVAGPCVGAALAPVPVAVRDGWVEVEYG